MSEKNSLLNMRIYAYILLNCCDAITNGLNVQRKNFFQMIYLSKKKKINDIFSSENRHRKTF